MSDINTLSTIIANLGFPIACVVGLGTYVFKTTNNQQEENLKRENRLYEIIEKQSEQLSEVKIALENLNDTLISGGR